MRVSNPTANAGGFWAQARGPGLPAYVEGKLETTLTEKFKTEVRMLPQSGPLEGQAVDTARSRHETGLSVTLLGNRGEGRRAAGPRYQLRKEIC